MRDVLAAPSVPTRGGKREGIPVVLMEAMATGLPVVASRLSGIPELVTDGVDGLLVPPGDDAALAAALAAWPTTRLCGPASARPAARRCCAISTSTATPRSWPPDPRALDGPGGAAASGRRSGSPAERARGGRMIALLFWLAVGLIVYTYVGLPAARAAPRPDPPAPASDGRHQSAR